MAIDFYYGSGSPYAWRVWLTLEHKRLPYTLKSMSFSAGDLTTPAFLALNPRHKVPVISDDGFVLFESAAIVDYLEDAYPDPPVYPRGVRERALARRMIREADQYLATALEILVEQILFTPEDRRDAAQVQRGQRDFADELKRFESLLEGDGFTGVIGAVDYTVYPLIALGLRIEKRVGGLGLEPSLGPRLRAWRQRFEALPCYAATYPPHWKA